MAIQIPRAKQLDPSTGVPSNQGVNINVPDQASAITNQTNAIVSLGKTAGEVYQAVENNKITSLKNELDSHMERWQNDRLANLRANEGDPTESYAGYEQEYQEQIESFMKSKGNVSDRISRHVSAHGEKVRNKHTNQMLKQRGLQELQYEENVYKSSMEIAKKDLALETANIDITDNDSFEKFESLINDIKLKARERAVQVGTASSSIGEDGKVKYERSSIAKVEEAKHLSEGVKNAIDNLIAAGEVEKAKMIQKSYGRYIHPDDRKSLSKSIKSTEDDNQANAIADKILSLPEDKRAAALGRLSGEQGKKVLKIVNDTERTFDLMKKRRQDKFFDSALSDIANSGKTFFSVEQMEREISGFKTKWDKMSGQQQKTIRNQIKPKGKTSPEAMAKVQTVLFGQDPDFDIKTISPSKFEELLADLSEVDKRRMRGRFESIKLAIKKGTFQYYEKASKILETRLIASDSIPIDRFGKPNKKGRRKLAQMKVELGEFLDGLDLSVTADRKEIDKFVVDFLAKEKKSSLFNWPIFGGGSDDEEDDVTPAPPETVTEAKKIEKKFKRDPFEGMNVKKKSNYRLMYKRANKLDKAPSYTDPKFREWVTEIEKRRR